MSHTYLKSSNSNPLPCDDPTSPLEEQSLDIPLLPHDASQSSIDSQCSSGYCSDSSGWAGSHGGSFRLTHTPHLKGTHKQLPKRGKIQSRGDDNPNKANELSLPAQLVSPITDDDGLTKKHLIPNNENYESVSPSNLQKPPPLPPRTWKKKPFYENHMITVPAKEAPKRSNSFPLAEAPVCSYCTGRSMSSSSRLPVHHSESVVSETDSSNRLVCLMCSVAM